MHRYKCWNAAMPTTAAIAKVATGTAIKTMLQIAPPSSRLMTLISWGFSLDAALSSGNTGIVELIQTDVAATVTAHVAAGVQPLDGNTNYPASLVTLGAAATGFTATVEGTITATRSFDTVLVPSVSNNFGLTSWEYQFMPDERPIVAAGKFLRVRATFPVSTNLLCWVVWDE